MNPASLVIDARWGLNGKVYAVCYSYEGLSLGFRAIHLTSSLPRTGPSPTARELTLVMCHGMGMSESCSVPGLRSSIQ